MDQADLNIARMAAEFGVGRFTINRWLNGKVRPRGGDLLLWSQLCGVSYEWLVDEGPAT